VVVVDGDGNRDRSGALDLEPAAVARLTARGGVEHRPVENDAAAIVDGHDARLAGARIGVLPEYEFRHRSRHASSNTCGIGAGWRSSHGGTGRPFSRKKAGLNIRLW